MTILWGWFVTPTFGLHRLALVPAMGLSLVVTFLTYQEIDVERKERSTTERWLVMITYPIFEAVLFLAMGLAVHALGAA